MMRMIDIIEKKRDGKSLSKEEIEFLRGVQNDENDRYY